MNNIFYILLSLIILPLSVNSQTPAAEIYDPPLTYTGNTDWAEDHLVSATEPFGRPSGVYRTSNNTIYIAIPDTNILANKSLVVMASSNNGASWSVWASVSPATIIPKAKMVMKEDSIYCAFLFGSSLYVWNIITNNFNLYPGYTNIRDFDITISSIKTIFIMVDLYVNNDIRLASTLNGGVTWAGALFLSSTGATPKISMSHTGDTAILNYFGPVLADTLTSAIRNVRYRESAPGTLSIVGTFTSPVPAGTQKDQFEGVLNSGKGWIFYTTGATGNIDLNCIQSNDNGTTYGAPVIIGAMPSRDEYWFNARPFDAGVHLVYYSDSLQTGQPTNNSDKIYFTSALLATPATFQTPVHISEHPPSWSPRGYIPSLIEHHNTANDVSVIWVGLDGSAMKLFYDRYDAIVGIKQNNKIPEGFSLSQNYPNPFNPETKIMYSLPVSANVSIIIYDVTGRIVKELVNEFRTAGIHELNFNASNISSGVYYYKIVAGDFTDVKKMMLIK